MYQQSIICGVVLANKQQSVVSQILSNIINLVNSHLQSILQSFSMAVTVLSSYRVWSLQNQQDWIIYIYNKLRKDRQLDRYIEYQLLYQNKWSSGGSIDVLGGRQVYIIQSVGTQIAFKSQYILTYLQAHMYVRIFSHFLLVIMYENRWMQYDRLMVDEMCVT
eukprot:TRINITY_DN10721_c1_g1_i1.p3 TRINITY_DN10721_c1_g1~~TRINITY_DN10721_c1_g1_i1.p3  ORF type:complete len:163 (-),score=2.07 TRINITY_DN10721_c1_g1_i1:40-528(-)